MSKGTIDFRQIISGSSETGIWRFNNVDYEFKIDDSKDSKVVWISQVPQGNTEIESRILKLSEVFFQDCQLKKNE